MTQDICITVNPLGLTQAQREAVAGFLLAFPGAERAPAGAIIKPQPLSYPKAGEITVDIKVDTKDAQALIAAARDTALAEIHDAEMVALAAEQASDMGAPMTLDRLFADVRPPASSPAAQDWQAQAAFGSAPPPLPPGAVAPFTAGAAPSLTALAGLPDGRPLPPSVTAPPAPPPAPLAPTAAPPSTSPAPGVDFSAALQADAQKLAATGQSGAAVLPNGVELDVNGLPWDARINGSTKTKNADGSWRMKRGVEPLLVEQVQVELRTIMALPQAAPVAAVGMPYAPPPPPVAPVTPTAPPAPAGDPRAQFVGLVGRVASAMSAGKITQDQVNAVCAGVGLPAIPMLANRLDLVPQVAAEIDAAIAARG